MRLKRGMRRAALALGAVVLSALGASAGGLTLAHPWGPGSDPDIWARKFSDCAVNSAGFYIEVVGGGAFGGPAELAEGTAWGKIDISLVPVTALEWVWPELAMLDRPFLVGDPGALAEASSDIDLLRHLDSFGHERNLRLLGLGWGHGVLIGRHGISEGGDVIAASSPITARMLDMRGNRAVSVPAAEIFLAIQHGAIEGAVTGLSIAQGVLRENRGIAIYGEPGQSPFAMPYAMVMNAETAEFFAEDVVERLWHECNWTTDEFNFHEVDDLYRFFDEAADRAVFVGMDWWAWQNTADRAAEDIAEARGAEPWVVREMHDSIRRFAGMN